MSDSQSTNYLQSYQKNVIWKQWYNKEFMFFLFYFWISVPAFGLWSLYNQPFLDFFLVMQDINVFVVSEEKE